MALNPHVLKKAQEELNRVVGGERLPVFSDEENLPYISVITKELLRWSCPFPIGIPKRVMEDDTYNGYLVLAGATIVENLWYVVCGSNMRHMSNDIEMQGNVLRRVHLPRTSYI